MGRLDSIQVLRGVAALLVYFFHLAVTLDRYSPSDLTPTWSKLGQFGVDLFFVISGFVMAYSVRAMSGHRDAALFLVRRWWRIAPLLHILATAHILYSWIWGTTFNAARIANCFTILPFMDSPDRYQYALVPAWTLGFEMAFYILIAGVLALRLPALWAAVPVVVVSLFGPTLMMEFAFGLFAYWLWSRGTLPGPLLMLAGAALLLLFPLPGDRFVWWGIPALMIFLAVLSWQPKKARAGKWLGTISYSLYLSHTMSFDALAPLLAPFGPLAMGVLLAVSGIAIAWLVYEAIESPLWNCKVRIAETPKSVEYSSPR